MRMMKKGIFAGHPSVALSPLDLALLALASLALAPLAPTMLAFATLHSPLLTCPCPTHPYGQKWQTAS